MTKKFLAIILTVFMIVLSFPISVNATSKKEGVITTSDCEKLIIRLDGEMAFCVERYSPMPKVGTVYKETTFNHPKALDKVVTAILTLNDGSENFQTASQYAVWQCYEPETPMSVLAKYKFNEEVSALVEKILDFTPDTDRSLPLTFYKAEGWQTVCLVEKTLLETSTEPETTTVPAEKPTIPTEISATVVEPTEPEPSIVPTEPDTTTTDPTEPQATPDEPTTGSSATPDEIKTGPATSDTPVAPKTGDTSNAPLYLGVMLLSIITMLVLSTKRKQS